MLIHSAVITGSVQFNNTDVSGITNVSSFATTASVDAVIIKTGSFATTSSVNELQSKTGSYTSTSSFGTYTASNDLTNATQSTRLSTIESVTGSFTSTSSFGAYSSSINTFTSSAITRLNTIESVTGSYASTSSVNNLQSVTGSYATTGSNQFNGNQSISGSITSNGTITAQTLVVQTVTSSVEFVTGSTRNGSLSSNTHQFTGSLFQTGSTAVFMGNVGIGTTSVSSRLQVRGVGTYNNNFSATNATVQIISDEMSVNQWYPTFNIAMVRQSLLIGQNSFGGIGFTTIDDSNNSGQYDAARIAIINNNGVDILSGTSMAFYTQVGGISNTNPATEQMRITSSGNVGIGTTSPGLNLSVQGLYGLPTTSGAQTVGIFRVQDSASNIALDMGVVQNIATWIQSGNKSNSALLPLVLNPSGGSVGIGTTAPNGGLTIVTPSSSTAISLWGRSSDNYSALRFQSNTGVSTYATIYSDASNLIFENNGSERMRITSTGVVQPGANGTQDLGTTSLRWGTIYTSDLSLSNGIGDYTIVEGEEKLYLYNNKNNKVYSFVLQEEDPLTATPKKS